MPNTPPEVIGAVAGSDHIKVSELRKAIGLTTFEVWVAYIWRRDHNGYSFASANLIAQAKGLSRPTVQRACKRLKFLGLMGKVKRAPGGPKVRLRRQVFGDYREARVTIPEGVRDRMADLPKWGGKRQGAGRKQVAEVHQLDSKSIQVDTSTNPPPIDSEVYQLDSKSIQVDIALKNTKELNTFLKKGMEPEGSDNFYLELPPYPSATLLRVAKVPAPPRLRVGMPDLEAVEEMVRAYRGAVESRYKKKSYAFARGDIRRNRFFGAFTKSAQSLIEREIAPASWAAFSVDVWMQYSDQASEPPKMNWVYSAKRLLERAGWYDSEAVSYGGGRLLFSKVHRDILRRYDGLKRESMRYELTEQLIKKWFPDGWESHYATARKENENDQARLKKLALSGEFIW